MIAVVLGLLGALPFAAAREQAGVEEVHRTNLRGGWLGQKAGQRHGDGTDDEWLLGPHV